MSVIPKLEKLIVITNDKVTEQRNQVLRDAIQEITTLTARINELERDDWRKYVQNSSHN